MPITLRNTGSALSLTGSYQDSALTINTSSDEAALDSVYSAIATSSNHIQHIQKHLNHSTANTHPFSAPLQYIHTKTIELEKKLNKLYRHTTHNMGHDDVHLHFKDMFRPNKHNSPVPLSFLANMAWSQSIERFDGIGYAMAWKHRSYIDFRLPKNAYLDYGLNKNDSGFNPLVSMGGEKTDLIQTTWTVAAIPLGYADAPEYIIYEGAGAGSPFTVSTHSANISTGWHSQSHSKAQNYLGGRTAHFYRMTFANMSSAQRPVYFKAAQIPIKLSL